MGLTDVARVLWRRAPLFLLCVAVGVGLGLFAIGRVDQDYEARATVLLVNSSVDDAVPVNPFNELSSSLTTTARVTASRLNDRTTLFDLKGEGLTGAPEVVWDSDEQQPIIRLLVTDSDPDRANESLSLMIDDMVAWLAESQAADGVPPDAVITANVVQRNEVVDRGHKGERRALAVILVVTLAVSLWVCLEVDRWLLDRRTAAERDDADGGADGSYGAPTDSDPSPDADPVRV